MVWSVILKARGLKFAACHVVNGASDPRMSLLFLSVYFYDANTLLGNGDFFWLRNVNKACGTKI